MSNSASIQQDIADFLEAEGFGTVTENIFIGPPRSNPPGPKEAINVFADGGLESEWVFNNSYRHFDLFLKIFVKTPYTKYAEGFNTCALIIAALDHAAPQGYIKIMQAMTGSPEWRSWQDDKSNLFEARFAVKVEES